MRHPWLKDDEHLEEDKELEWSSKFMDLRPKIKELLKKIKFKRIGRSVNARFQVDE